MPKQVIVRTNLRRRIASRLARAPDDLRGASSQRVRHERRHHLNASTLQLSLRRSARTRFCPPHPVQSPPETELTTSAPD
jgi:hypothetical protein